MLALILTSLVLTADPIDWRKTLQRADELFGTDEPAQAETLYRKVIDCTDPFYARQAHERLIYLYIKSGRYDKAIQHAGVFRAWLLPRDPEGLGPLEVMLGECYLGLGHYGTAEEQFAKAMASKPPLTAEDLLRALEGRARVAMDRKDSAEKTHWNELVVNARRIATEAELNGDSPLRITAIQVLAEGLVHQGDKAAALKSLGTLLDLLDPDANPIGRRDTLRQRANILASQGQYQAAVPLYREALALHKKHRPSKPMIGADILSDWTSAATAAGDKAEANTRRTEALAEYAKILNNPAAGEGTSGPLAAFAKMQQLTRTARQFRQALELSREAAGRWPDDPLLEARLQADRGGLELLNNAFLVARDLLRRALKDLDSTTPADLRTLPGLLVNLAASELGCDTPERADPLLERCTLLYQKQGLPIDVVLAECHYLRGAAAAQRGEYFVAIRYFRESLKLADQLGSVAEPVRYNSLLNTALIHKEQGDYVEALTELALADKSLQSFADPDDLAFALIRAVRSDILLSEGKSGEAAKLAPGILELCQKYDIYTGYLWSTAKHALALNALENQRDAAQARAIWTELLDGKATSVGKAPGQRATRHLLLARTLNYLGTLAEVEQNADLAQKYYAEAAAFEESQSRVPVTTHAITLWRLAVAADHKGDKKTARALIGKVFDIADEARQKTFGAAAQRASFYAEFRPIFDQQARWAVRDGDGEELIRIVTRTRSRTFLDTALSAGVDPRDGLVGPDRDRLIAREAAARSQVSQLRTQVQLISNAESGTPKAKSAILALENAQKEYTQAWKEIVNADPVTRSLISNSTQLENSLAKLKETLGEKTGLIAYLFSERSSYAVLLAGPHAPAEIFPLRIAKTVADEITDPPTTGTLTTQLAIRGAVVRAAEPQPPAPAVNPEAAFVPLNSITAGRLIDRYLAQISHPGFRPSRGIVIRSTDGDTPPVATRSESLGEALLPRALRAKIHAAGLQNVIVVPDGPLHKIPMECLVVTTDKGPGYAIDEMPAIAYVPSVAILGVIASRPRANNTRGDLLTVGNPAYPVYAEVKPSPEAAQLPTSQQVGLLFRESLPRLPGTAIESERIRKLFPADQVTSLMGEEATERHVTDAVKGKRYLHIAAHGFSHKSFGNMFAAIALAPSKQKNPPPEDDGLLTLHEIARLDLRGCELTVLSACVTNVGPQRPMEAGVTLAGAFLTAGSRSVVASCWSVDDAATSDLMSSYFQNIHPQKATRMAYAQAMKQARLKVRSTPGFEDPFYWAPFIHLGMPD